MILIELVLKILRLFPELVTSRLSSFVRRALGFSKKNRSDLVHAFRLSIFGNLCMMWLFSTYSHELLYAEPD